MEETFSGKVRGEKELECLWATPSNCLLRAYGKGMEAEAEKGWAGHILEAFLWSQPGNTVRNKRETEKHGATEDCFEGPLTQT